MKYAIIVLIAMTASVEATLHLDQYMTYKDKVCIKLWTNIITDLEAQHLSQEKCSDAWNSRQASYQVDGARFYVWMKQDVHKTITEKCTRDLIIDFVWEIIKNKLHIDKNYAAGIPLIEDRGIYGKHYRYQWTLVANDEVRCM
jgi:hypothetical protein